MDVKKFGLTAVTAENRNQIRDMRSKLLKRRVFIVKTDWMLVSETKSYRNLLLFLRNTW